MSGLATQEMVCLLAEVTEQRDFARAELRLLTDVAEAAKVSRDCGGPNVPFGMGIIAKRKLLEALAAWEKAQ